MEIPSRPTSADIALAIIALLIVIIGAIILGCSSPTEITFDEYLQVQPYGVVAVKKNGYEFNSQLAERAVRDAYIDIASNSTHSDIVLSIKLDRFFVSVVPDIPNTDYPSIYYGDTDHGEVEPIPGYESLIQGIVMHRICDRLKYYEPNCHW